MKAKVTFKDKKMRTLEIESSFFFTAYKTIKHKKRTRKNGSLFFKNKTD